MSVSCTPELHPPEFDVDQRWVEGWARVPIPYQSPGEGRTHGIACSRTGDVFVICQAVPSVLRFDSTGKLLDRWGEYPGAHGLTLAEEDGREVLWVTDEFSGNVEKCSLEGKALQSLSRPGHPAYENTPYCPTWIAVDEIRHGGQGDVWVADGYGAELVHHFRADGSYHQTLDGTEGGGRFSCPHGLAFDTRSGHAPLLYIADRGNRRFQVYDRSGRFQKLVGADFLSSPDSIVFHGTKAVVPELFGRVLILDREDRLEMTLGENPTLDHSSSGWANSASKVPGIFNSPHACAVDESGNLYVAEWRIGGRLIKIENLFQPSEPKLQPPLL